MTAPPLPAPAPPPRTRRRVPLWVLWLFVPPLLWLGVLYVGSLLGLLGYGFRTVDDFTGQVLPGFTLASFQALFVPSNLDIIRRTMVMSLAVTAACALIAFPVALYIARYARGSNKALWLLLVTLPLWASYLVRVYAWRLILAQEGVIRWTAEKLGLGGALDALLATPGLGGSSLANSSIGMFLVFVYVWLPYMILPLQASLERVSPSLLQASADLGARPAQTFWRVLFPLALPGLAAGSIFTFSLTLGDYIIPGVVGSPGYFIGQMVYTQQGAANNLPLAAAFSVVPIVIIFAYLAIARRMGAFDAL